MVEFAETLKESPPSPLPLAPLLIVTQLSPPEADHSQPSGELTLTLLLPPSAPNEAALVERE